ncbi:hypothetical protein [Streptomyces roseoverticillatus]|uniref:Uncharacterized protein n=1 Tax=Streptomyces roseoverticillatus TaxID=66429 RepID=A0ABV3IXW3_9ACTN
MGGASQGRQRQPQDWAPGETEGDKVLYVFDGGELHPEDIDAIKVAAGELLAAQFHPAEASKIY